MYPGAAACVTLYEGLRRIDEDLARQARSRGCPWCREPLDAAGWRRKPRGCDIPDAVRVRHGLCCRGCRRRVLPDSAVFLGRKVYFGAIVLISIVARQRRLEGSSARALRRMFGVSRETLRRWLAFFLVAFPESARWKALRGLVAATVRDAELPSALLAEFDRGPEGPGTGALRACLGFLARGEIQA